MLESVRIFVYILVVLQEDKMSQTKLRPTTLSDLPCRLLSQMNGTCDYLNAKGLDVNSQREEKVLTKNKRPVDCSVLGKVVVLFRIKPQCCESPAVTAFHASAFRILGLSHAVNLLTTFCDYGSK